MANHNATITKFSTVFTLVDFDCWFSYAEREARRVSDRDVFRNSDIYTKLENKALGPPPRQKLPLSVKTIAT